MRPTLSRTIHLFLRRKNEPCIYGNGRRDRFPKKTRVLLEKGNAHCSFAVATDVVRAPHRFLGDRVCFREMRRESKIYRFPSRCLNGKFETTGGRNAKTGRFIAADAMRSAGSHGGSTRVARRYWYYLPMEFVFFIVVYCGLGRLGN